MILTQQKFVRQIFLSMNQIVLIAESKTMSVARSAWSYKTWHENWSK